MSSGTTSGAAHAAEFAPLTVYVAWHPAFGDGAIIARALYDWLSASTDDLRWRGLGIPVRYRTGPKPQPIALENARQTVLVALLDEHWVADRAWREYLSAPLTDAGRPIGIDDGTAAERFLLLPAMLHGSVVNLRELRDRNLLIADPPDEASDAKQRLHLRIHRLQRQVTQALGRRMLRTTDRHLPSSEFDEEAGARPTVFISHAKRDGASIGRRLREEITNYGQLRPFFDENDLPHGFDWRQRLTKTAENIDSLIAVMTDSYASRPWCRAEVLLARRPVRVTAEASSSVWAIRPVVAVDHLTESFTSSLPELGNVPVMRWRPESAARVLDRLVLEMLLKTFHLQIAAVLPQEERRLYITWIPDLPSLVNLLAESGAVSGKAVEVVFPGHGLRRAEREILEHAFKAFPLVLRTYNEVRSPLEPRRALPGSKPRVAFSAGFSPNEDLHGRGLGAEHLHEAIVRIGRMVLDLGHAITYGGILPRDAPVVDFTDPTSRPPENFTETLRDIVRDEVLIDAASGVRFSLAQPIFYSYIPRTAADRLTAAHIANDLQLCAYVRMDEGQPRSSHPEVGRDAPSLMAWQEAKALSEMRRSMTGDSPCDLNGRAVPICMARILVGGSITGFAGTLPGVAEEALYAIEAGLPLYVVGGFGGAAEVIAQAIAMRELPARLSLEELRRHPRVKLTHDAFRTHGDPKEPEELHARLSAALTSGRLAENGLSADENHRLATTTVIAEIVDLISKGLSSIDSVQSVAPGAQG
jgi:hypothetical protein